MIIECVNCNKKFEVNSELIPTEGRSIQCGSCGHLWFFEKNKKRTITPTKSKIIKKSISIDTQDNNNEFSNKSEIEIFEGKTNVSKDKFLIKKTQKKTKLTLGNFLSYIIVSIVSFIALIIILDTFKLPLYNFFPQLETILYNLFETLEDIRLFVKDLI